MKILINASMLTKNPTGVGLYNIELLKHLLPKFDNRNIDYTIYCYDSSSIQSLTSNNNIKKITLGNLIDQILLKYLSFHRIIWNIFILNRVASSYDLIYALTTYGSLNNQKQIITVHDLIALQFPKQHIFQHIYFTKIVPVILSNCKSIIAISDFTATEIIKNYSKLRKSKIKVIKNGVDHITELSNFQSDKFIDHISRTHPFCLIVGASYYHKNLETLLKVAEVLQSKNIYFVVAGRSSSYYNNLIVKAKDRQLTNVSFMQYVDEPTLSSLYKKAALHIYISLYEGFGFPPAEASFFGTRSIISNQPALVEIYGDHFPTVPPLDVDKIAFSIEQNWLTTTKDYTIFNALKTVYNWEKTAEKVYRLIITNC